LIHDYIKKDAFVRSQKLVNLSFPRKRESSNYTQLWILDFDVSSVERSSREWQNDRNPTSR